MDEPQTSVELGAALVALRDAFVEAMWDSQNSRVRFRIDPVELTVQVTATRSTVGSAGVKWHVLHIGGEKHREAEATQTLKLRLMPVLFDAHGSQLPDSEQLISDRDDGEADIIEAPIPEPR